MSCPCFENGQSAPALSESAPRRSMSRRNRKNFSPFDESVNGDQWRHRDKLWCSSQAPTLNLVYRMWIAGKTLNPDSHANVLNPLVPGMRTNAHIFG